MKRTKSLSVIIINLHSLVVDKVIEAVLNQDYPGKFKIIVVGQDKHRLLRRFKACPQIKIVVTPKPLIPSEARNIGIRQARGDYFIFLDSDCLVQPDWFRLVLKNFQSEDNRVVGGSFWLEKSGNFWRFCDNLSHFYAVSSHQKKRNIKELNTANLCIPRLVVKKVGLFDESLVTGEDKDYLSRVRQAGSKLVFEPKAKVVHWPDRKSFGALLKHSFSWGQNSLKVRLKYTDLEKLPFFMKNRWSFFLAIPLVAFGSSLRVFTCCWYHCLYFYTFPLILASKLAWCWGAFTSFEKER